MDSKLRSAYILDVLLQFVIAYPFADMKFSIEVNRDVYVYSLNGLVTSMQLLKLHVIRHFMLYKSFYSSHRAKRLLWYNGRKVGFLYLMKVYLKVYPMRTLTFTFGIAFVFFVFLLTIYETS